MADSTYPWMESWTRSLITRPLSSSRHKSQSKEKRRKFDLSWECTTCMNQMNRLVLGKDKMMMVNTKQRGLWCAVFVWFQQFLLKSLRGKGGGVYFVPHHLPSQPLLRSRTYFNIIPATYLLRLVLNICWLYIFDFIIKEG